MQKILIPLFVKTNLFNQQKVSETIFNVLLYRQNTGRVGLEVDDSATVQVNHYEDGCRKTLLVELILP